MSRAPSGEVPGKGPSGRALRANAGRNQDDDGTATATAGSYITRFCCKYRRHTYSNGCLIDARYTHAVSTGVHYFGPLEDRENTISAEARWIVCAVALLLFVVAAAVSAMRKDVTRGFDEVAHASYVVALQHAGEAWPDLSGMHMLDPSSFHFTSGKNYLNHPPTYYDLMALLGPRLEGHPHAIIVYRLINVAIAAIGLAALLAISLVARLPRPLLCAYVVPIACIPVLAQLAGSINNDNAAFAGGGIASLAVLQLLATERTTALVAALCGVAIAAWAKLTGFLLVGGMFGGVFLWFAWRRRLQPRWIVFTAIAMLLAIAPYIVLWMQYGSPAPNMPGQIAMLRTGAHVEGWDVAPRMSPVVYVFYFIREFIAGWMPTRAPRNEFNYAMLVIPVAAVLCGFAGVVASVLRIARRCEGAVDVVIVASAVAIAVTFAIHIGFSYQRHLAYGWMMDAYPRYYLPLAAFIPLAGLSLAAVIEPRVRALLIGFLVAGPVVFRMLGAPIG